MESNNNGILSLMNELNNQTNAYLTEIKTLASQIKNPNQIKIISYFTHSLNISHHSDQESLCLGSYHIYNAGNQPITNPHICIKIPKETPFSFQGQYVYEEFKRDIKGVSGWLRTNERTDKEEFWLKPLEATKIQPDETLSFSNFQITWAHHTSYAGSITGYTYFDEQKEGIRVINPINLGGTVPQQ